MARPAFKSLHGRDAGLTPRGLKIYQKYLVPALDAYRTIYYVDSEASNASDSNDGLSQDFPLATLDGAFGKTGLTSGDAIVLMPGHAEDISTADNVDMDVAGVTVVGLGNGTKKPTFTYTAAAGEITVGADDITITGLRFVASVTDVLKGINVEAGVDYTSIIDNEFLVDTTGTDEFAAAIYFEDNNTGPLVQNNIIDMGLGGAVAAIHLDADTDRAIIRDNLIYGDYSTACIAGDTTLSTDILIQGNILVNGTGGNIGTEPGIELLTGTTGIIADNYIVCNLATKAASIVADTCLYFENYYNEDITGTGGLIGTVSADD